MQSWVNSSWLKQGTMIEASAVGLLGFTVGARRLDRLSSLMECGEDRRALKPGGMPWSGWRA